MPESKTSRRRISAIEKQRQALELRNAGRTYAEIAKALNYRTHTSAIAAVKVALKRTLQPAAEEYRALTLERLTAVLRTFWPLMIAGPVDDRIKAARPVLQAIEQMRALLNLDVPKPQIGTEEDPLTIELRMVQDYDYSKLTQAEIEDLLGHARIVEQRLALPPGGGGSPEAPGG